MKRVNALLLILSITLLTPLSATAAERGDDWEFTLAPLFIWGMGIEGTTSTGPVTAPLDIEFKDALENLDGMFTVHFEAKKRDLALFAEYQYTNLGPDAELPTGQKVNITFKNTLAELGAGYRVTGNESNDVELIGGARYAKQDLNVSNLPSPPLPVSSLATKESWWDVFVGGRWTSRMSDRWKFIGRADVATGGSDVTWNLSGMFDYRFRDWGSVFFGYKYMNFDYENGSGVNRYVYDATQQGPLAGLAFYW